METMFSLTVKKQISPQRQDPERIMASSITFSGSFSGTIFLEIPLNLLKKMAMNFGGQELTSLSEVSMESILKEALNIIAGNAMVQINTTHHMGLGLPEIVPVSAPKDMDKTIRFNTSCGTITTHIRLN